MSNLNDTVLAPLTGVDLVVAAGSVDGVLTSAALLRLVGSEVEVCFTQAFTLNQLPVGSWEGRRVALVDIAVNNRDEEMTRAFIGALLENGNQLVAVIDEHDRGAWLRVLEDFSGLAIEPQSQATEGGPKSSAEVLRRALAAAEVEVDDHTLDLMNDGDAADKGTFLGFGKMANKATKSNIRDNKRRIHVARHLATGATEPSEQMGVWIGEYEEIERNHAELLSDPADSGTGLLAVDAGDLRVDTTALMFALYRAGAKVAQVGGRFFVRGKGLVPSTSFGLADGVDLDLIKVLEAAGVDRLSGFARKVTVAPENTEAAAKAIAESIAN